ncbi:MAG: class I SAM-dependent rRNA methyltransferase [Betaproteobacteria bacterium]
MPTYVLNPGREKSLLHRHPWVFSGAIGTTKGEVTAGATVDVIAEDGRFLGRAAASPTSQIRARIWSFDPRIAVDAAFFEQRLRAAVAWRDPLFSSDNTAARLVHAESDGLPGLIVDRYADTLVVQLLSAGVETWREVIFAALTRVTGCTRIFERSDVEVRVLEGLPARSGPVSGDSGIEIVVAEHGLLYDIDIAGGQKTGFYLDQRNNRQRVAQLAGGRDVLDCFCYSGGFSLGALRGGARSVLALDSSADAIKAAQRNARRNGLDDDRVSWVEADVFKHLRLLRDQARQFDLVILDPPKLAPTIQHVERAARAYKDINLLALKLLRPGGLLASFSCSGGVGIELFQKIVAGAAVDARVDAQIIERLGPGADHPILLSFPEGDYLKGLLVRLSN